MKTSSMQKVTMTVNPEQSRLDLFLMGLFMLLLLVGIVMIYSASVASVEREMGDAMYYLKRHSIFLCLGLCAAWITYQIPTKFWQQTRWLSLAVVFLLLGLVLVDGIGKEVNGSQRWIDFGFFGLQASELAKLGIIIFLAGYLVKQRENVEQKFSAFIRPLVVVVLASTLLMLEPDFGATAVLMGITMGMLFLGGVRILHFLFFLTSSVAALSVVAMSSPYRVKRIMAFLDPWGNSQDSGYQLTQSLIAVGRGEWTGVGLGNSMQKMFYLPEAHTDFVFAIFAEEFGLIGVTLLIALFVFLVLRAFKIAKQSISLQRYYQAYLACGLGIWIGLQALVNIGVNLGALPTKGLTLPFISYGGSNLIVMMIAVALLLRVSRENHEEALTTESHRDYSSPEDSSYSGSYLQPEEPSFRDALFDDFDESNVMRGLMSP